MRRCCLVRNICYAFELAFAVLVVNLVRFAPQFISNFHLQSFCSSESMFVLRMKHKIVSWKRRASKNVRQVVLLVIGLCHVNVIRFWVNIFIWVHPPPEKSCYCQGDSVYLCLVNMFYEGFMMCILWNIFAFSIWFSFGQCLFQISVILSSSVR